MQGVDNLLRLVCLPILPVIPAACASLPEAAAPEPPPTEPPPTITVTQHADGIVFAGVEAGANVNITVHSPPAGAPSPGEPDTPQARVEAGGPAESMGPPEPTFEQALADAVVNHEGWETEPYIVDNAEHICAGLRTYGDGEAMTNAECIVATADYMEHIAIPDARQYAGEDVWEALSAGRQAVLAELAMMMGIGNLLEFTALKAALQSGNWEMAAREIGRSRLALQVGAERVRDLQAVMRSGEVAP